MRRTGGPASRSRRRPESGPSAERRGAGDVPRSWRSIERAPRPHAAPRGAAGQDLHGQRGSGLVRGHARLPPRRRETERTNHRSTTPPRREALPPPQLRRPSGDAPALLRDSRPPRRPLDRRSRRCLAPLDRTRCSSRSRARDPGRPPRGPHSAPRCPRGEACAASMGGRPPRELRSLLGSRSGRYWHLCRDPRPRYGTRRLSPRAPRVVSNSPPAPRRVGG